MLLRPRQEVFLSRTLKVLDEASDTLGIAPTGAGKTVLFCHLVGNLLRGKPGSKALLLAHRDELTDQNVGRFESINPEISTSVVNASGKDWGGQAVFAMVQTLAREKNLTEMPTIDYLVIDEAHHSTANTYQAVIDAAKAKNAALKLIGFTATPNRSDGVGLRKNFSNISDQIFISELINSGHLVTPRTFIIDVGAQSALKGVKKLAGDFDMASVETIMNKTVINQTVVDRWKEICSDRNTVVFCSTVSHAEDVLKAFLENDISAEIVTGELGRNDRNRALENYHSGKSKVIVNVSVLTEGWDHPPTSCIILLRPSSAQSTMIQMVGRGLRVADPREFPDTLKRDCIILDFGISSILHGKLEQDVDLSGQEGKYGELTMECPSCQAKIPISSRECPLCGREFLVQSTGKEDTKETLSHVDMVEVNLLARSSFQWVDLFHDEQSYLSSGFNAWGGVFKKSDHWVAIGGEVEREAELLAQGDKIQCFAAADDWLNTRETQDTAHKSRSWLKNHPTDRQLSILPKQYRLDFNLTRYRASALISFQRNKAAIRSIAGL